MLSSEKRSSVALFKLRQKRDNVKTLFCVFGELKLNAYHSNLDLGTIQWKSSISKFLPKNCHQYVAVTKNCT